MAIATTTEPAKPALPTPTQEAQMIPKDQRLATVRQLLAQNLKPLAALLGKFMPPERFAAQAIALCQINPKLLECSRGSLLVSAIRVAQLQLSLDPALGQAWVIPRKNKRTGRLSAEFQLGYRGLLALAYRSPHVRAIRFNVVRTGERFAWRDGRNWKLEHEPGEDGWPQSQEELLAAWVIVELANGAEVPRVMYAAEISRHASRSQAVQAGGQTPWKTDLAAMALKTVLADACRRLPLETDASRAVQLDHMGEVGKGQEETTDTVEGEIVSGGNGAPKPAGSKLDRFAEAIEPPAEPEPAAEEPSPGDAEDFLGDALNDPEPPPAEEASGLLSPEARTRIRNAAAEKGLTVGQLDALCGAPLEAAPAEAEAEILAAISRVAAPRKK